MDSSDDKRDRVVKAALGCRMELIAYARSLLGNYVAADDVVQEALLVVFNKFDQFQEGTSILAWCRSIVRIEVLRAKRRHDDAESWREALSDCLERVPQRGQSVLKARFADGLSYRQIGERVGMSIEAVRKALFRLKRQVRSCVETSLRAAQ